MAILMVPDRGGPAPWLRHWLARLDGAVLVAPGDGEEPARADWLGRLAEAVQRAPGALLVGHGLGALLIAHLAAERPELPVAGALLVAPADVDTEAAAGDLPAGFSPLPVRPFAFPSVLVAGSAGSGPAPGKARVLANLWEAVLADPATAPPDAAGDWPAGRALLAGLARQAAPRSGRTAA